MKIRNTWYHKNYPNYRMSMNFDLGSSYCEPYLQEKRIFWKFTYWETVFSPNYSKIKDTVKLWTPDRYDGELVSLINQYNQLKKAWNERH